MAKAQYLNSLFWSAVTPSFFLLELYMMEESSGFDNSLFRANVTLGSAIVAVISFFSFVIWMIITPSPIEDAAEKAPFLKATAIVTSKDTDQRLSIKSTDLPKGGDVVAVDQFVYGTISSGDRVCVKYKSISDDPQISTEFVGKGSCQK